MRLEKAIFAIGEMQTIILNFEIGHGINKHFKHEYEYMNVNMNI